MSTVDQTVRECIAAYPLLFEDRIDVLHHILCVLGSGYEWRNGEPVSVDGPAQPWTAERHDAKVASALEAAAREGKSTTWLSVIRAVSDEDRQRALNVLMTLDERVQDDTCPPADVYPQSEHALLMNVPADVTADWAAAAEQMRAWATEGGWTFPFVERY